MDGLPLIELLLLICSGFFAGALNSLGGGGPLLALPVLVLLGVPSVEAKASGTVALFPAGVASAWVYRRGIKPLRGTSIRAMLWATFIGGACGSLLLLITPSTIFDRILPWLLLITTLTLWLGERLPRMFASNANPGGPAARTLIFCQFLVGGYAGYFGGAVGLMMMAIWSAFGHSDIKASNALRAFLVNFANAVSIFVFILSGSVFWEKAMYMAVGAFAGGIMGANVGRKVSNLIIRRCTITIAVVSTAAFFACAYS